MNGALDKALALRRSGEFQESNELLADLVRQFPDDAVVNYQYAVSLDLLGQERRAVPFYERAIELGLPSDETQKAIVGLGSSYRALGEYEKSKAVFEKGTALFPDNRAIQVFFAMTLYNLQEHRRAMELLLRCLLDTTGDDAILGYKKAIAFYAERLDETWDGWWPEPAIPNSDTRRHGRASICQRRKNW